MKTKAQVIQRLLDEKKIDNEELVLLLENHVQYIPYPVYYPYGSYYPYFYQPPIPPIQQPIIVWK